MIGVSVWIVINACVGVCLFAVGTVYVAPSSSTASVAGLSTGHALTVVSVGASSAAVRNTVEPELPWYSTCGLTGDCVASSVIPGSMAVADSMAVTEAGAASVVSSPTYCTVGAAETV